MPERDTAAIVAEALENGRKLGFDPAYLAQIRADVQALMAEDPDGPRLNAAVDELARLNAKLRAMAAEAKARDAAFVQAMAGRARV